MSLKIIHTKNLRWIDITSPNEKDIVYLKENFKFHPLDFEDVVTPATRTKIDEYDQYLFIILLFPVINRENGEIKPSEVDFFVGKDFIITIHDGFMNTLNNMFSSTQLHDHARIQYMTQGTGFLLFSILEALFKRSAPILDKINQQMLEASKSIFQIQASVLEHLLELKKNIIMYRRIVRMHRYVLGRLSHSIKPYLRFKDSSAYFQDLTEYAENIWDVLGSDKESVESFEETNQSLGTHRINEKLRVLTVLSVMVSILTLITDILIFFERDHLEKNLMLSNESLLVLFFFTVLSLVSTFTLLYFRKRRWV